MNDAVPLEISVEAYDRMRRDGAPHVLLDVREPKELALCKLDGSIDIPMGEVPDRLADIAGDGMLVVLCRTGNRSGKVVSFLREQGYDNATNLVGGINAWAERIDPEMEPY